MKKIILVSVGVVVILLGVLGTKYYQNTYQTQTAYAVVPKQVPVRTQTKDDSGKAVADSKSYQYQLQFVKANGQKVTMDYELMGKTPKPLKPNAVIQAKISKSRVATQPTYTSVTQLPSNVKESLKLS
ncbi:DUF1093 domain-containing protein [Levilactobacillus bambusae]|uniref:DUF1093 domain-containing protein n=1 Tax=Levilactobacillus bambusae TaxID=2024736 RepID=A0A2V1N1J5_9LACO|nr:DUF1093 domain-containing protein [Levilactobacillus bambusae]PWG00893.1 hypothetical protein DCM90_01590 [Levilactobacillus bambusae]